MVENPKIFLSHSSKDKELAEEFANQIRSFLGFPQEAIFVSSEPEGIDIGADWFNSVIDVLKQAEAFIILITPNSMMSNWVWFEIGYFWNKNKDAIYPLTTPKTSILHPLNTLQAKDLINPKESKVFFDSIAQYFQVEGNYKTLSHEDIVMSFRDPLGTSEIIEVPNIFGRYQ